MKTTISVMCFLFVTGITTGQTLAPTNQIILKLKNETIASGKTSYFTSNTGNGKIDGINEKFHAVKIQQQGRGKSTGQHFYVVQFSKDTDIQKIIDEYYETGEIEYAEPDYIGTAGGVVATSPNDQFYGRQWGIKNDGTFSLYAAKAGADIDMENAWNIEQGDTNIVVAIIDSGTKMDHPEFAGRIWSNKMEIANNSIDDDANGCIDDVKGWDFVNTDNDPTDDFAHGTNVAGIVGANGNNSIGYAGVDWNCKLMILKGLNNQGAGSYSMWANAMYYAVDNGARVINMSMGGINTSTTLQNAVNYAISHNVVVVVCMMNSNSNVTCYPAGLTGVIAVGATNADDTRASPFYWNTASGSNYGNHISVVAPGNIVYGLDYQSDTNYELYGGGTSQASPHVAGLAALLLAQDPSRTPGQVKSIIESTAQDQVGDLSEDAPGWDQFYGHGRIDAFAALSEPRGIQLTTNKLSDLLVYPNPSSGAIKIIMKDASPAVCKIINEMGQVVYHMEINSKTVEIMEKFIPGIYFLLVEAEGKIASQKIMVQ